MVDPVGTILPFYAGYVFAGVNKRSCTYCRQKLSPGEFEWGAMVLVRESGGLIERKYHFLCFFADATSEHGKLQNVHDISNFECLRWCHQEKIRMKVPTIASAGPSSSRNEKASGSVKRKHSGSDWGPEFRIGYRFSKSVVERCQKCELLMKRNELEVCEIDELNRGNLRRYHLNCFAKYNETLNSPHSGTEMEGFNWLRDSDQIKVTTALPSKSLEGMNLPSNIQPAAETTHEQETPTTKMKRLQNGTIYKYRDQLVLISKYDLNLLLQENGQTMASSGIDEMLDCLSDQMAFGALKSCPACNVGRLVFRSWTGYCCTQELNEWATCGSVHEKPERALFKIPDGMKLVHKSLEEYQCKQTSDRLFEKSAPSAADALVAKDWPTPIQKNEGVHSQAESLRTLEIKNDLAVDPRAEDAEDKNVYQVDGKDGAVYSVSLACADLQAGINCYSTIQVLEQEKCGKNSTEKMYWLFRSGGIIGGFDWFTEKRMKGLDQAVQTFQKEFIEQTGNQWADRNKLRKLAGKKTLVEVSYKHSAESEFREPQVVELMQLIIAQSGIGARARQIQFDFNRMPLGRLSQRQIEKAVAVLVDLRTHFLEYGQAAVDRTTILSSTNKFYTLVPHNFSTENPPQFLDNLDIIEEKWKMMESLPKIKMTPLPGSTDEGMTVDSFYDQLNVVILHLSQSDPVYGYILQCVQASPMFELMQVFEVNRLDEKQRFNPLQLPNRKLLWYGSEVSNYANILLQGLVPAPAPSSASTTHQNFGAGIRFSDLVLGKALRNNDSIGLLLLCEVALGKVKDLLEAVQGMTTPPTDYNSVKYVGLTEPSEWRTGEHIFNDVELRIADPLSNIENVVISDSNKLLEYNAYVVYDPAQVRIRYLAKIKSTTVKEALD